MKTKDVIVLSYQKEWKEAFLKIKDELNQVLKDKDVRIEHVGSTSVEGLAAKPVIDIDIIILRTDFEDIKRKLEVLDYHHEGNLGILDREAFKYVNKSHLMKHHLYVCPIDSDEYQRHLSFRDWLKTHPEDREAYGSLKMMLAKKYPHDIDRYMEEKSPLIEEIYQKIKKKELPVSTRSS
jgi:GrpB-like predicted nucleotidyltransferase (UPF0157 family)